MTAFDKELLIKHLDSVNILLAEDLKNAKNYKIYNEIEYCIISHALLATYLEENKEIETKEHVIRFIEILIEEANKGIDSLYDKDDEQSKMELLSLEVSITANKMVLKQIETGRYDLDPSGEEKPLSRGEKNLLLN